MSTITLLTDFGLTDAYVGVLKGVILRLAPHVRIVDICHNIPPQDTVAASFMLAGAYHYFAEGTIHVAVVDPGVGTYRRPIAIAADGHIFVGPDNGLFSFLLSGRTAEAAQAIHLTERRFWLPVQSSTFHGRDIFAPVAAHLARGIALAALGQPLPLSEVVRLDIPLPRRHGDAVEGTVMHVDHFGNLTTNIPAEMLRHPASLIVQIADAEIVGLSRTYGEADVGRLLALVGSSGYLEIAVRGGSAADRLRVRRGVRLRVVDRILDT